MTHIKMPKQPIDDKTATRWGLAALKSVGVGVGIGGGNLRVFDLINMETYRAHRMTIADLTAGVGLPVSLSLLSSGYTYFTTSRPVNFPGFDGKKTEIGVVDIGVYSWTTLKFFDGNTKFAEVKSSGWGLATPETNSGPGKTKIYYSDGIPLETPAYEARVDIPSNEEATAGFRVAKNDDSLVLKMSGDVLFDFDKDWLHYQATEYVLPKIINYINSTSGYTRILIEGHTDNKEKTPGYNLNLSRRRAQAVKDYFVKWNVFNTAYKIEVAGFGAQKPVAPNNRPDGSDDPEGREKNRRVELFLFKK